MLVFGLLLFCMAYMYLLHLRHQLCGGSLSHTEGPQEEQQAQEREEGEEGQEKQEG